MRFKGRILGEGRIDGFWAGGRCWGEGEGEGDRV